VRIPSPFAVKPVLNGRQTTLRPFSDEDLPGIAAALADAEVLRLTGSIHSSAEAIGRQPHIDDRMRSWYKSRSDQDDRLDLAIVDRHSAGCVGEVVLNNWEPANESCSFRILIGPGGRGRGLGTEATSLILHYAFTTLSLHRVGLEVYAFNPRARRVYEKVGFRVEGAKRDAFVFDNQRVDSIIMSALATEWASPVAQPAP
jgi:RimJ/RimL family protein N-acetyltransferase